MLARVGLEMAVVEAARTATVGLAARTATLRTRAATVGVRSMVTVAVCLSRD